MNYGQISPLISEFLATKDFNRDFDISLAGTAGSQRMYYRLSRGLVTYILLVSPESDADFAKFSRLTQFYRLLDFPVPQIFCIDDTCYQVLLEDLGDVRLFDYTKIKKNEILPIYKSAIDILIELQTNCFAKHYESPDILSRVFGINELKWETDYFLKEFIMDKLKIALPSKLEKDIKALFADLAAKVDSQPKTIMHRDFQSQNIMVCQGKIRVIDYQGSRLGSRYYDIASLLFDPYQQLEPGIIKELFNYFHSKTLSALSFDDAYHNFLLAASQRVMQALGAYCFLSEKKGLEEFQRHVIPAYDTLRFILKAAGLKELEDIILSLSEDKARQLVS